MSRISSVEKIWLKHYPRGVPEKINPDTFDSLVELINASCKNFKDLVAFSHYGTQLTYAKFAEVGQVVAAYFQQVLRLEKGERIALMLPNILQYPVIMLGALQAGLVIVNVNPLYTPTELASEINDAETKVLVVLKNFTHTVAAALPSFSTPQQIIVTEIGDLLGWPKSLAFNWLARCSQKKASCPIPNVISFKSILNHGKKLTLQPIVIKSNDLAFLQYTGGTTGVVKAAVLTHRNLISNVEQLRAWVSSLLGEGREVFVTALPLYHIFSLTVNCLTGLRLGAHNLLVSDPRNISQLVRLLKKTRFSVLVGVNTLFKALLKHKNFSELDFGCLKLALGGGASVERNVADAWQKTTGKLLWSGYGLTEASPVVCAPAWHMPTSSTSVGLALPSTEIVLRDENGQDLSPGETGELCIKGPQVMQCYWRNPEETRLAFSEDGWLLTGDIAHLDKNGFVDIIDRKKEMILVSGFNVYPSEIENVIASHPKVAEVAVSAVPSTLTGEAVKAFVVRKDSTLTVEALLDHCRKYLTTYKVPHEVEFRDSLPKSAVGKVLKRKL